MTLTAANLMTLAWVFESAALGWAIVALRRASVLKRRGVVSGDVEWLVDVVTPAANDNHQAWPDAYGPWPNILER